MDGLQMEELYTALDSFRRYVEEQLELLGEMGRLFYEASLFLGKAALEAIDAVSGGFEVIFRAILEAKKKPDAPRRNWGRPRNQKLRPLLLDRRSRVFRCRNAI